MNKRQKKKQYKKLHGHNPPKGADGRYIFHTPEIESVEIQPYKMEDIEQMADCLRNALTFAMQAMSDFAAAVSQAFANMAEQYKKTVIDQEDPVVVVARNMAERRMKCRRKGWRQSKTWTFRN